MQVLRIDERSPYQKLLGVGGVGGGIFFALEGDHTLGRNESRTGRLLDVRDFCKLHIVIHYIARLLGARVSGTPFHVIPVARVGDDVTGDSVLRDMREAGIDTRLVLKTPRRPTLFSVCFQYPDGTGGNVTTSNSASAELSGKDLDAIRWDLTSDATHTIALSLPEIPLDGRHEFLALASRGGAFRAAAFVSAEIAPAVKRGMFGLLDLVSLNQEEAERLVGCPLIPNRSGPFIEACLSLLGRDYPDLRLIVSAGENGAYGFFKNYWNYCSAPAVNVSSTAGAGDALLAGVLSGLAAGIPLLRSGSQNIYPQNHGWHTALELGVLLASYKVQSPHTIHPDASLSAFLDFVSGLGVAVAPEVQQLFQAQAQISFPEEKAEPMLSGRKQI